jgi:ATP-dependent Clp protease ATP-binding subunit ClpA
MDLSKFTEKSQAALQEAQNIAMRNQHQAVDVEHLMLALLEQEDGLVPRLFEKAKVAPDLLRAKVEEELNRIPRVSGDTTTGQGVHVTQRLNKLLVKAQDQAKKLQDEYVSVEHLVLTMFDARNKLCHQVAAEVREFFPRQVFDAVIPRNVRLSESPSHGLPVILYDPSCRGAQSYMELAQEVTKSEDLTKEISQ